MPSPTACASFRRSFATPFALLAALAAASGCGPGDMSSDGGTDARSGVDPRGTDGTFNFSWIINGVAPNDPSNPCQAAGVRFIRMVVVDNNNMEQRYDEFRFDCTLGTYRSAQPELRAGTYRVFWEADAADGHRLSLAAGTLVNGMVQPVYEQIMVQTGTHIDFDAENRPSTDFQGAPTNFATGSGPMQVALSWAPTAGAAAGVDCATAGVSTVTWTLRMSNNVPVDSHTQRTACDAMLARVAWDQLNWDRYALEVQGFDAMGTQRWNGRCGNLLVNTATGPTGLTCLVDRRP